MNRRLARARPLFALVLATFLFSACGKRGDPLAPYVKTPQPATGLEISQVGEEIEIRVTAPRTTTENRPLPVIDLEWFQGPATGEWSKVARSLTKEQVAPGEVRIKRFPTPAQETRFSARAESGKARSAPGTVVLFKPAPIPAPPSDLAAVNVEGGVELRWVNPTGAEPWPTPTPTPTPTTSPSSSSSPSPSPASPGSAPSPVGTEALSLTPPVATLSGDAPSAAPAQPTTSPLSKGGPAAAGASAAGRPGAPVPALPAVPPTGIRIFRTDGALRSARDLLQASTWLDPSPKFGDKPCYALRYYTSFKPLVESAPTEPVCVEIADLAPPEPPIRLVGDIGNGFVELSWAASPSNDVARYRVYKTMEKEQRTLLLETDGLLLRVRDPSMTPGLRTYEVAAVDKAGNESLTMPSVRVVVP